MNTCKFFFEEKKKQFTLEAAKRVKNVSASYIIWNSPTNINKLLKSKCVIKCPEGHDFEILVTRIWYFGIVENSAKLCY